MNASGDAADQIVKYSFEGMEIALRLTGAAAKNFAVFAAAALKNQEKSHGKTNLLKLLRQGKQVKFFSVPSERMREFAGEAKRYGLLYVAMCDKKNPDTIEIAVVADDATKVNRIMDRMTLDFLQADAGEAALETVLQEMQHEGTTPEPAPEISVEEGLALLGGDAMEDEFSVAGENFTQIPAQQADGFPLPGEGDMPQTQTEPTPLKENPSEPSLPTQSFSRERDADDVRTAGEKPSVRQELREIKSEKAVKDAAEKQRQPVRQRPPRTKKNVKGR